MADIQRLTNTEKKIGLRDFQQIDKDETQILKDGEETKTKTYSCVVWTEKDYSQGLVWAFSKY